MSQILLKLYKIIFTFIYYISWEKKRSQSRISLKGRGRINILSSLTAHISSILLTLHACKLCFWFIFVMMKKKKKFIAHIYRTFIIIIIIFINVHFQLLVNLWLRGMRQQCVADKEVIHNFY